MRTLHNVRGGERRGVILIVVLVLVVMLSLAGFAFMNRMATEYEATVIGGELRQAHQTMASAETLLLTVADEYAGQPDGSHPFTSARQMFSSRTVQPVPAVETGTDAQQPTTATPRRWRFSIVQSLQGITAAAQATDGLEQMPDASPVKFGMVNESGKLHLGRVMLWEKHEPGAGQRALLQLPGMTPEAADSILDWMDEDEIPRELGAESSYYQELDRPYSNRNGLPETLEELLFVKGVTRDMFYGVGQIVNSDEQSNASWNDLLTVSSAESNFDRNGKERIDLNDVYPSDYMEPSGSEPGELSFLPEALVKYILLARLYGITVPSSEQGANESLTTYEVEVAEVRLPNDEALDLREIMSLTDLIDSHVRLPHSEHHGEHSGAIVKSPLSAEASDFTETMNQLEERTTLKMDNVIRGRINITAAPEPVLRALLDDVGIAGQLVQQRTVLEAREKESTAWLLTRQIVDLATYRRIYPHITTRGAVHSGEIVVYRRFGGPFLRRMITIDASVKPAQRRTWTDVTPFGLPVDRDLLRYAGAETNAGDDLFEQTTPTNF
jgi:Tfp pilus assembly protein PilX